MFAVHSPAVGDRLYPETHDEHQALAQAVYHVIENGADAEVRDDDGRVIWHVEADTPIEGVQPAIVTDRRGDQWKATVEP